MANTVGVYLNLNNKSEAIRQLPHKHNAETEARNPRVQCGYARETNAGPARQRFLVACCD